MEASIDAAEYVAFDAAECLAFRRREAGFG